MKDQIEITTEEMHRENIQAALVGVAKADQSLFDACQAALNDGIEKDDLMQWALETVNPSTGKVYSESWVRQCMSKAMLATGERQRKAGGGRKGCEGAKDLLAFAIRHFGQEKAASVLLSAHRLAKKLDKAESAPAESAPAQVELPVAA